MSQDPAHPDEPRPDDEPHMPDMHLDRLEAMARRAPGELARRADEAIARRAPRLAPSNIRRRFRRRSVALFTLLGLMAVMASAWMVLRESTILREAMESQLSERFGGNLRIKSVKWDGWNRIIATDLDLRARGWEGAAATVCTMRRAEVVFSPWSLLLGRIELVDMEIDGLTVRIIERVDHPGDFNFLALRPTASPDGKPLQQPQRALLSDLRIEIGSATGGDVALRSTQQFAANFQHRVGDSNVYEFSLEQKQQDEKPILENALSLKGTWNESTFTYEADLSSLRIDESLMRALPAQAQRWAARSELAGRIERAHIEGSTAQPLRWADIVLRDVTLRERDSVRQIEWGRLVEGTVVPIRGDVTVMLGEAKITLRGNELDVAATRVTLAPGMPGADAFTVPLEISAHSNIASFGGIQGALDPDDLWLERSVALASWDIAIRIPKVDARPTADGTPRRIELPIEAARALALVGARDWAADISVTARRAAGSLAADGTPVAAPIELRGKLTLLDGTIESPKFPYRMSNVKGTVEVSNDLLVMRGIQGRGSDQTAFTIDGEIELVGADPGYNLHLFGTDVSLDRKLVGAIRGAPARIFAALLADDAWRALNAAGILDESTRPGGIVGVDLTVKHPRDGGERVEVTGPIKLQDVRVVLDAFPYPMRAKGELLILDERVEFLGGGINIETPTGGKGFVSGHLEVPRHNDTRLVRSFLDFRVDGEKVTRALLAAIPISFEDRTNRPVGWPGLKFSPISSILMELGLEGSISATGTVLTRPDESDAVTTNVQVHGGAIRPTAELAGVLRENGLSWPGRMTLDDVHGLIVADAGHVTVSNATARHGAGTVAAEGRFDLESKGGSLEISLKGFPIERDLVRLSDGPEVARIEEAWNALTPVGNFDGEVTWNRDARGQDTYAHVRLDSLTVAQTVKLDPVCSDMYFRNGELRLDGVDLRGPDTDDSPLVIEADGVISGPTPNFHATIATLSLDSPLVARALEATGATAAQDVLRDWRLRGAIDAQITLPGRNKTDRWSVALEPSWIGGEHDEMQFQLRRQSGSLLIGPSGVVVDELEVTIDRGTATITGALASTETSLLVGELRATASVSGNSPDLRTLMPSAARRALDQIEFDTQAPIWTDSMRILVDDPRVGSPRISVIGDLNISDARFQAGIIFDRIDGSLAFDLSTIGGQPAGTIGLQFDQVHVMGRRATTIAAALLFHPDSSLVELEDLSASMYGGRIAAHGWFTPAEQWEMHVSCTNIGFGRYIAAGMRSAAAGISKDAAKSAQQSADDGLLRGRLDVAGTLGADPSRRGSGRIAVVDGRMMEFPLGLSILQVTQLMLPLNAAMEQANMIFEIDNSLLRLKKIDLSSGTLLLEGTGDVRTDSGALALRFHNRGKLPLLSDLYGVVTDQFFVIDVGGTIQDPQPRVTPIPVLAPAPTAESTTETR
ncbi:MAG: hypothetical protein WCO75_05420 [Planctomycetota bacterium]